MNFFSSSHFWCVVFTLDHGKVDTHKQVALGTHGASGSTAADGQLAAVIAAQGAASGLTTSSYAPAQQLSDTTRGLCSGAYVDVTYANEVIAEIVESERKAVPPSFGFDLDPVVRHCLRAVHQYDGALGMCHGDELFHRQNGAERIRYVRDRNDLRAG